jgi:hypothetical protein
MRTFRATALSKKLGGGGMGVAATKKADACAPAPCMANKRKLLLLPRNDSDTDRLAAHRDRFQRASARRVCELK